MSGMSGGNEISRRQFVRGAALGAFALATPGLFAERGEAAETAPDSLHRRVRAELKVFTDWVSANGVKSYIGEIGWPDDVKGIMRSGTPSQKPGFRTPTLQNSGLRCGLRASGG